MKCPNCGSKTYVTKSIEKKDFVVRYRKCKKCGKSIRTREMKDSDWMYKEILKKIKEHLDEVKL